MLFFCVSTFPFDREQFKGGSRDIYLLYHCLFAYFISSSPTFGSNHNSNKSS